MVEDTTPYPEDVRNDVVPDEDDDAEPAPEEGTAPETPDAP